MMKNFQLLESEADSRQPLACYEADFNGQTYFHLRRVYRDKHGMWAAGKQGITCLLSGRDEMLARISGVRNELPHGNGNFDPLTLLAPEHGGPEYS